MSDPIADAAKAVSPSDPQTPVPPSSSPVTVAIVASVNKDGTVTANINAATGASTIYWSNASVPKVGQKILVLSTSEGVLYATGVVGSSTELPPLMAAYPVGSIYTSTLSTNPATLLGFGTWSAFAVGRVMIGVGTSDQTFTAGALGGASTVTIFAQYLPSTSPWQITQTAHSHGAGTTFFLETGGSGAAISAGSGGQAVTNTGTSNATVSMGSNTSGGGTALPTLPPYIVVYAWERIA